MAECELQLKSEQFLLELARHPDSVHKSPTNQYQHFVNAFVVTNNTKMKRADAVKRPQVEWKEQVVGSKEHYVAALKKLCNTWSGTGQGVLIQFSRYSI